MCSLCSWATVLQATCTCTYCKNLHLQCKQQSSRLLVSRCYNYNNWCRVFKILWRRIYWGGKGMAITTETVGVSQLLGARARAAPTVYAFDDNHKRCVTADQSVGPTCKISVSQRQ